MTITVDIDPLRPNGGYARLTIPASAVTGDDVTVTVFDAFSERYLGEDGWQSETAAFGPYPVEQDGENAHLSIGPEIVNQIEEYAALRLTVGNATGEVSWPDEVVPLPGAARLGGLAITRSAAQAPVSNLVGQAKPAAADDGADSITQDADVVVDQAPKTAQKRTGLYAGAGILLFLLLGALAWFLMQQPPASEPTPVVVVPDLAPEPAPAVVVPPADPCADQVFADLASAPFEDQSALLLRCAGQVSPDRALAIIERGVDNGDGAAMALLGQLYDSEVNDSPIEVQIGLSLVASPPRAAEYYARAVAAGNSQATPLLAIVCERMRGATDTLSRNATEEYCTP